MIGRLKALVLGFVLGIFLAPRSGRASRELLLERIGEFFADGARRADALEGELAGRREARRREAGETALADPPLDDEAIE